VAGTGTSHNAEGTYHDDMALRADSPAAPLSVGVALAAGALYVAANDPMTEGTLYLPCVVHRTTGLWCPGCGLTRGTHALLTGHPLEALSTNLFTPVVVLMVAGGWLAWTARSFGRPVPLWWDRLRAVSSQPRWFAALLVVLVTYGVLRNIPTAPFDALAP
jgi:hypothetical protein